MVAMRPIVIRSAGWCAATGHYITFVRSTMIRLFHRRRAPSGPLGTARRHYRTERHYDVPDALLKRGVRIEASLIHLPEVFE